MQCESIRGRACRSELGEIGERAYARRPGDRDDVDKLYSRWVSGACVGKTETTDECLVSTPEAGILRMRSVRRRPASERCRAGQLGQLRGSPWDLKQKATPGINDSSYDLERHAAREPN